MPIRISKRSVTINGRRTSISLEEEFWAKLKSIADDHHVPINSLVSEVSKYGEVRNLSSALRVFVLKQASSSPAPDAAANYLEKIDGAVERLGGMDTVLSLLDSVQSVLINVKTRSNVSGPKDDKASKVQDKSPRKTRKTKISPVLRSQLAEEYKSGKTAIEIAKKYEVSTTTVFKAFREATF